MFLTKSPTHFLARISIAAVAMMAVFAPALAHAEEVEYLTQSNGNILWTLIAAILVMLMQAGFGCVEAGFTRAKSAGNIMMKNFLDFSVGSICFFLFGFAVMFGLDAGGFTGTSGFALGGVSEADLPWTYTFWFFQSVFAATAATIVSGGMAERTKFSSYIIVSIVVTGLIYPLSGHWAWGSLWLGDDGAGWLEGLGFCDFAGSSVVHSLGGWLALAGAWCSARVSASIPRTARRTPFPVTISRWQVSVSFCSGSAGSVSTPVPPPRLTTPSVSLP